MERNANIDLIKIVSIMGVCSLHFFLRFMWGDPSFRWEYILFYASGMAIPLFFMVNGYLILSKNRVRSYYIKRIINIIKIVVTVNILWFLFCLIVGKDHPNPIIESFNNLFLKEGFFSPFWFFGSIIIIYLFLILIPFKYITKKNLLFAIAFLTLIQFAVNEANLATYQCGMMFEKKIPQTFRLYDHLNYFFIGGLLCKIDNSFNNMKVGWIAWGGG